jgi:tripartite-type tricarboxylate transporter receptor subunit TctC
MMQYLRCTPTLSCVTVFLAITTHIAHAQTPPFPTKPLRIIASMPPGGGIDMVARAVATKLGDALGQTVFVDNRPGANGSLAAELTAKAPPDGHTLMVGAIGNLAINGFFYKKLGYDPLKDLAPITAAVSGGQVVVVHPSVPAKSVKELIAIARARPGELAYASSGTGGSGHLAGALFQRMAKIVLLHVPYKGGAPAIVDLAAGQTQLAFPSPSTSATFIEQGKLRALAVTTAKRSKIYPQLPTLAEAGVAGYESASWYGLVAPAKTPHYAITRLNREIVQILSSPEASEPLLKLGMEVWTTTPEAFAAHIKSEHDKWGRVIREAGITEK